MTQKQNITFDVAELKEAKETGRIIQVQEYVDGDLMTLTVEVH